jgi:hypothetical protein
MNETEPIKEEYIVYICEKCKQYTYAKTNQNAKKCPRCHHSVPINTCIDVLTNRMHGTIVRGVTAANTQVRLMQASMHSALNEFTSGAKPIQIHKASGVFTSQVSEMNQTSIKPNSANTESSKGEKFGNEYLQFIRKIKEWQTSNSIQASTGFPVYMLNMILLDLGYPEQMATYLKYKLNKQFGFRMINKDYCYLN